MLRTDAATGACSGPDVVLFSAHTEDNFVGVPGGALLQGTLPKIDSEVKITPASLRRRSARDNGYTKKIKFCTFFFVRSILEGLSVSVDVFLVVAEPAGASKTTKVLQVC